MIPFVTALSLRYRECDLYDYNHCVRGNVINDNIGVWADTSKIKEHPLYSQINSGEFEIPNDLSDYTLISNGLLPSFKNDVRRFKRLYVGYYGIKDEIYLYDKIFDRALRQSHLKQSKCTVISKEENDLVMRLVMKN